MSETSKCRERLAPYCSGFGLDLGFGGDPIVPQAICFDLHHPYARVGEHPQNLAGDARDLWMFWDNVFDFVFSSHLLEDFENTEAILREWMRVLKPGGNLVLYCPDEPTYREHCRLTGQAHNEAHKIADFGAAHVRKAIENISGLYVAHCLDHVDEYSFELVARKI
jgi:predicted SAM-dependent methyltransferase